MNTNNYIINKDENESELLFNAVFEQIQECGDIISSILIIYKFIEENDISTKFNRDELRQIALRSVHNETSTYLWHINALIAASCNFEHLLLGIEMMFDRFLGNKSLFIKEKQKEKLRQKNKNQIKSKPEIINNENNKNNKNEFVGNEIVSFVNSYYKPSIIDDNDDNEINQEIKRDEIDDYDQAQNEQNNENDENEGGQEEEEVENERTNTIYINDENMNINKINERLYANNNGNDENEEEQINNKEYMKSYRGKISSPISFRMKQQKRMMQSERRQTSKNVSIDLDFNDNSFNNDDKSEKNIISIQPQILSPFNVSKFAKTVDLMSNETHSTTYQRKNV